MYYRCVSDYGWGDKSWCERYQTEEEAVKWFNRENGTKYKTAAECMNHDRYLHYIEEDYDGDVEDWDWMDS